MVLNIINSLSQMSETQLKKEINQKIKKINFLLEKTSKLKQKTSKKKLKKIKKLYNFLEYIHRHFITIFNDFLNYAQIKNRRILQKIERKVRNFLVPSYKVKKFLNIINANFKEK